MIYVYAILAIVFSVILLFLFLPGKIQIGYGKSNTADIKLFFFGGMLKIPLMSKKQKPKKQQNNADTTRSKNPEKQDKGFIEGINNTLRIVRIIKKTYSNSRKFVSKRLTATLDINISFGLYDAALTGIATGAVWTLLYELLGLISTVAIIENHKFNVDPVFDKALLRAEGMCILRFRPVNIIGILIHILKTLQLLETTLI